MKRKDLLLFLNEGFVHTVKDNLWGNIPFTTELKELLKVRNVEKLSRIKQNGPTYLIYPGSVHTRLNHSIGVYALSREILLSISRKNEELPLTEKGIMSFFCSALLHDIGHFPYAHSLKELSIREHEEIAATLILEDEELKTAVLRCKADPVMTGNIIDKDRHTEDKETLFYRGILSGTLDPDKLDYLSRDAYFSGVPYGTQNTDYIIKSMDYRDGELVLDEEALVSVEHVLFSKYMMYKTIYWHKGTRSATAMIKKALLSAIEDGIITFNDLYLKDDDEFSRLEEEHLSYKPFSLLGMVKHGELLEKVFQSPITTYPELVEVARHLETRKDAEKRIYRRLKAYYPQLEEYLVIIDIPEPIRFECDIRLLRKDGSVSAPRKGESVFNSSIGSDFSSCLRTLSIFAPDYVSLSTLERILEEEYA